MKLTKAAIVSSALLAIAAGFSPLAHASLIGDSAMLTFNQKGFATPIVFNSPQVVGAGTEFSASGTDVFGQVWTVNGDIFADGITLSWTESTRSDNSGNISSGANAFGFDLAFASSVLPTLFLVSSIGPRATSAHTVIISTGPNAVHFGFDHMNSGESYTFAVPEPGTSALVLSGLGLLSFAARRKARTNR